MEKLTIARIGQEKVIEFTNKKTGKSDSFKKVGFLTNEYGERWMDLAFRGQVPIEVGKQYDFEIKSREWNGKTYYDAELPRENRRAGGGGISEEQWVGLNRKLDAIYTRLGLILGHVDTTTSDGRPQPNFDVKPQDITFDGIDPELQSLMESAEDAMR